MNRQRELQKVFLETILPAVERHGKIYFRRLPCAHQKADCLSEMVALAWKWFVRLAERGKDASAFPTVLASFAARAVRSGRRVCGQERAKDVLSSVAQRRHGFGVGKLPDFSTLSENPLSDALTDNTVSPVPDQVQFRCDFPAWLDRRSKRDRALALDMAKGEKTAALSRRFGLSPARVSQLRREFHNDYERYLAA